MTNRKDIPQIDTPPPAAGGEVSAQTHGDGAGGDLGEAGDYDQVRAGDSAEAGSEREGDGQAIGEADYDVADRLGAPYVRVFGGGAWGDTLSAEQWKHGAKVVEECRAAIPVGQRLGVCH